MRGVDEFEGVGFLEGEGVRLDSRMPFNLPMPTESVWRNTEGGPTGPSSTIQSFKSIKEA